MLWLRIEYEKGGEAIKKHCLASRASRVHPPAFDENERILLGIVHYAAVPIRFAFGSTG